MTEGRWGWLLWCLVAVQILAVAYYIGFLLTAGYLPTPFFIIKSDTFMDLFNTMFFLDNPGKYTEWRSVYPPLNFVLLELLALFQSPVEGGVDSTAFDYRAANAQLAIIFVVLAFASFIATFWFKPFQAIPTTQRVLFLVFFILSPPFLFAIERGNILALMLPVLGLALLTSGWKRALSIAVLINLKPYFVVLLLVYLLKRRPDWFVICGAMTAIMFLVTGVMVDRDFLHFFLNLVSFAEEPFLFSFAGILSFTSSLDTIGYLFDFGYATGLRFRSYSTDGLMMSTFMSWVLRLPTLLLLVLMLVNARRLKFPEMAACFVAFIPSLSVSTGAYTLIFLVPALPVILNFRLARWFLVLLVLINLPLDLLHVSFDSGYYLSYFSGERVLVTSDITVMSVLRPILTYLLLWMFVLEFALRTPPLNLSQRFKDARAKRKLAT